MLRKVFLAMGLPTATVKVTNLWQRHYVLTSQTWSEPTWDHLSNHTPVTNVIFVWKRKN